MSDPTQLPPPVISLKPPPTSSIAPTPPPSPPTPPSPPVDQSRVRLPPGQFVSGDLAEIGDAARGLSQTGTQISGLRGQLPQGGASGMPQTTAALERMRRAWTVALGEAGNALSTVAQYGKTKEAALRAAGEVG